MGPYKIMDNLANLIIQYLTFYSIVNLYPGLLYQINKNHCCLALKYPIYFTSFKILRLKFETFHRLNYYI